MQVVSILVGQEFAPVYILSGRGTLYGCDCVCVCVCLLSVGLLILGHADAAWDLALFTMEVGSLSQQASAYISQSDTHV